MNTLNKLGLTWKLLIPLSILLIILTAIFHLSGWFFFLGGFTLMIGLMCLWIWGLAEGGM